MALENLVTGFLKKLLGGEKTSASEVLKDVINEAMGNKTQQPQQPNLAPAPQVNNDPVVQQINEGGYVWQSRLWRRHVMAQMFKLLHRKSDKPISEQNYDDVIARRFCTYTWRMLSDELRAQALLSRDDPEQFAERNRWFNRAVVEAMARDLVSQGFDIGNKVLQNLPTANDPNALVAALKPMQWVAIPNRQKSFAWLDAYKGAGAYFTMKNLILFHNCQVHLDNGQVLDRDASFDYIRQLNGNLAVNGQQMFAVMMKLIADNNFDWHA